MEHASHWRDKGLGRYEILERLTAFEKESHFDMFERNLFEEGPHLTSSPALPWGDEVRRLVVEAYTRFIHGETWLSGGGARKMEKEVISMMGEMFGNPDAAGLITSGGSESNIGALIAAKARALTRRFPDLRSFEVKSLADFPAIVKRLTEFEKEPHSVVMPSYTHYSLYKGCGLLGLEPVPVPPVKGSLFKIDPNDIRAALRDDTIAIVGTAGTWPFGTIDPIAALGKIAAERDLYFHVDACFGGFIIPFLERCGYYDPTLDPWDFRVPAVCSISADLHKNGMVPPPASSLYFRDGTLLNTARLLAPPSGGISGTRGTGPIAASWTMLQRLGLEGFKAVARHSIRLRDTMIEGLLNVPGMKVVPESRINLFVAYSEEYDLRPVVAALAERRWMMVTHSEPEPVGVCICTMPQNDGQVEAFLSELAEQIQRVGVPIGKRGAGRPTGLYGNQHPDD